MRKEEQDSNVTRIGRQVLSQQDLEIEVQYKDEIFTLAYPTPLVKTAIEAEIARRLGGYPRESYSPEHIQMVEATTYVHNLVILDKSPKWFTSAWNCVDDDLVQTLFAGYLRFRSQFQERLRQGQFESPLSGKRD